MINYNSKGFSLIELAIVLAVLTLFIGGAISTYSRWVEKQLFEEATANIDEAEKAIIGFAMNEGYLPCSNNSANIDGLEDRFANQCANLAAGEFRTLPFNTLGLSFNTDPWGNPYRYRAAPTFSDANNASLFTLSSTSAISIENGLGTSIASEIAFVVYSLGPDQGQVNTVEQTENLNNVGADDNTFAKADTFLPFNENDPVDLNDDSGFDDIISWVSTHVLKYHMVEAEKLPRD